MVSGSIAFGFLSVILCLTRETTRNRLTTLHKKVRLLFGKIAVSECRISAVTMGVKRRPSTLLDDSLTTWNQRHRLCFVRFVEIVESPCWRAWPAYGLFVAASFLKSQSRDKGCLKEVMCALLFELRSFNP